MSQAYYSQWQRFPKPTEKWQTEPNRITHEGRTSALRHILTTSKSVLDVGCGIGLDHKPLSTLEYYGVDVTPRFIKEASSNGVPCQVASVLNLPFKDETFETVYCRNLLLHLPPDHVHGALDEMIRVAQRQVVTVEPAWQEEADYHIRELVDTNPADVLLFFSNAFGEEEMMQYAKGKNVSVKLWRGHDEGRSEFLHKPAMWQVTVYGKGQK